MFKTLIWWSKFIYWAFLYQRIDHSVPIPNVGFVFQSTQFEEHFQKVAENVLSGAFSAQRPKDTAGILAASLLHTFGWLCSAADGCCLCPPGASSSPLITHVRRSLSSGLFVADGGADRLKRLFPAAPAHSTQNCHHHHRLQAVVSLPELEAFSCRWRFRAFVTTLRNSIPTWRRRCLSARACWAMNRWIESWEH